MRAAVRALPVGQADRQSKHWPPHNSFFTHIDAELLSDFEKLRCREPIFTPPNSAPRRPTSTPPRPIIGRLEPLAGATAGTHPWHSGAKSARGCGGGWLAKLGLRPPPPRSRYIPLHLHAAPSRASHAPRYDLAGQRRGMAHSLSPGHDRLRLTFHGNLSTVERQQRMVNDGAKFVGSFGGEAVDMSGERAGLRDGL